MEPSLRASALAAAPAGVAILLVFFVWHWLTIAPVWTVLAEGLLGVALASVAVGWAWSLSRRAGRFAGPWGGLAFGAVFTAGIAFGEVIGLWHGAWETPAGAREIVAELRYAILPSVLVTLLGWRLVRAWRGALAFALASAILLLYLGGNIAHSGGVGVGWGLFLILFPGYLAAGALVGWLEPRLTRARARPGTS